MPADTVPEAHAVHAELLQARESHHQAEHRMAILLRRMEEHSLYLDLGYGSIGAYARSVLDLTERQTRDFLHIARGLPGLPVLERAFQTGQLGWTKVRELLRVVTEDTEAAWVDRAKAITSRALEALVAPALLGEPPPPQDEPELGPPMQRMCFDMHAVDAEVLRDALALLRGQAKLSGEEMDRGAALAAMARRVLEDASPAPTGERYRTVLYTCPTCERTSTKDAEVNDTVSSEAACDAENLEMRPGPRQGHLSRSIPPAVRRAVLERDGRRCTVPLCRNRLWLDVHHTVHRADGGGHDPQQLLTLCCLHHRLHHDGRLAITCDEHGVFHFVHADHRREWYAPATHVGHGAAGSYGMPCGPRDPVGREGRAASASEGARSGESREARRREEAPSSFR